MTKPVISVVILTKNEEKNIEACLKSLSFCDELVVVDDRSTDDTQAISKRMGAKVYERSMEMNFSEQSNFGLSKAKGNWILFVDADERITPELAREIRSSLEKVSGNISGFVFKRLDYMWGRLLRHGESGTTRVLRLVKKGSGKWKRRVHPHFEVKGETRNLRHPIFHYPHPSLGDFIISINKWSTWHALANKEEGKKSTLSKIIIWPIGHFFTNYFLRLGFLDGMQGFVYAIVMSAHSFLSWSKLLILEKKAIK